MTDTYAKRHRASSVTDYESWVVASVATTLNAYDTGDVRTTMIIVDDEPLGFIPNAGLDVQYSVRRLTPTECERLQGFPDEHTRWDELGKEQSDTQRYKQLGNAVSVPVASYVGALIMHVDIRVFR